jgi:hypothetical protein
VQRNGEGQNLYIEAAQTTDSFNVSQIRRGSSLLGVPIIAGKNNFPEAATMQPRAVLNGKSLVAL